MINLTPELKKRIFTGVLGASLLLALLLTTGRLGVFLFVSVISLGMVFEFTEMIFTMPDKMEKRYVLLSMTWMISVLGLLLSQLEFPLLTLAFMCLFSYFLFTAKRYHQNELLRHFKELGVAMFGLVYLAFIPQYFLRIADYSDGMKWIILFLLIVWTTDTGAYFVGMKYGRRKLYPEISPKKTVEGLGGGLGTSLIVTLVYKIVFFQAMSIFGVLIIPVVVGSVAQLGDLCESFLKRAFQKKDSGAILPGHGGLLDRFDAVVFSLPIMYACVKVFG